MQGFRSPYLQTAADTTFEVIQSLGFEYESCMSTFNRTDPPLWPYTLDYGAKQVKYFHEMWQFKISS